MVIVLPAWRGRYLDWLRKWGGFLALFGLSVLAAGAVLYIQTLNAPTTPPLKTHVIDHTQTLGRIAQVAGESDRHYEQRGGGAALELEARLTRLENERGTQVAILLVPTTAPEDIDSYANRIANDWKIGRRDIGDGVLLVIAKNDRKIRLEVSRVLEEAIPDLVAQEIVDAALPYLRRGRFAAGLSAAVEVIDARIAAADLEQPWPLHVSYNMRNSGVGWPHIGFVVFVVALWVGVVFCSIRRDWALAFFLASAANAGVASIVIYALGNGLDAAIAMGLSVFVLLFFGTTQLLMCLGVVFIVSLVSSRVLGVVSNVVPLVVSGMIVGILTYVLWPKANEAVMILTQLLSLFGGGGAVSSF